MTDQPATDQPTPVVDRPASPDGARRPRVLVFDVNETLSDMSAMADRFTDVGAPGHLAATWFSQVLRDGFALTAVEDSAPFAVVAQGALRVALHAQPLDRDLDDAVSHVMAGFSGLDVHDDVLQGVRALGELGIRLVTLSNGSASVAEGLFARAGIADAFERVLSVEDAGCWKPAPGSYAYALAQCDVDPEEAMLVAVHPWDTDGASRAGLATAWINRSGGPWPDHFRTPDLSAASLVELADRLR